MCKAIFAVKNGGLMSHRHNFVTISGRKFTENAEKPGRRAPERVPLPGFLSIKWHVVFKMKAHRRPVSGCGSQRMLHALERRSHSADHGPSFASLYSPFCRYATSSPDRGKSLLAGSGRHRCCSDPSGSHPQQLLTVFRAEHSLLVDIPTGWEPRTEQQPTGLIAHPAAQGRAV